VGDIGCLGDFVVLDCQEPYTNVVAHIGHMKRGMLKVGQKVEASIDEKRRGEIRRNHTATHLLHWALTKVLGPQVRQAGSIVAPDRLRFDFNHHKALTKEEVRKVEDLVNERIVCNQEVASSELLLSEVGENIKQFFGEKYGERVRLVEVGESKELCGGCHAFSTGEIGMFLVTEEKSVAAGIRRIVAVTGQRALAYSRGSEDLLDEVALLLKSEPRKLLDRVGHILEEQTDYAHEIKVFKEKQRSELATELTKMVETVDGISVVGAEVPLEPKELRALCQAILDKIQSGIIALATRTPCSLVVRVSDDLIDQGYKAGELIKKLAPIIDGKGGGKADFAQAGGKNPDKIPELLQCVSSLKL